MFPATNRAFNLIVPCFLAVCFCVCVSIYVVWDPFGSVARWEARAAAREAARETREAAREASARVGSKAAAMLSDWNVPKRQAITRQGKCVVWNVTANEVHDALFRLDSSLHYQGEGPVTVFLTSRKNLVPVGTYSRGFKGYRETLQVHVVFFPDASKPGIPVGTHELAGDDPPDIVRYTRGQHPERVVGSSLSPIVEWIRSLPTGGAATSPMTESDYTRMMEELMSERVPVDDSDR